MKQLTTITLAIACIAVFATSAWAIALSDAQKAHIDNYLADNDLNKYGDPAGTTYMGGSPLFDETSGSMQDRYEYVLRNHPHLIDEIMQLKSGAGSDLAKLETELEMAIKDYQLELNAAKPDKFRLAYLEALISQLRHEIQSLYGEDSLSYRRFGVLPEVFSLEVKAALESDDYARVAELVDRLNGQGPDAVKYEAEHLFALQQQLRFRLSVEAGEKANELRAALDLLAPVLETLKC